MKPGPSRELWEEKLGKRGTEESPSHVGPQTIALLPAQQGKQNHRDRSRGDSGKASEPNLVSGPFSGPSIAANACTPSSQETADWPEHRSGFKVEFLQKR